MAGAPKKIKTPEDLYNHFLNYNKWRLQNPRIEKGVNHKEMVTFDIERERPCTWYGFDIWLRKEGIIAKLEDYKANTNGSYSDFSDIIHMIDREIYEDKYSGAVTGIYQHNIIARDLGLSDKKEVKTTEVSESNLDNLSEDELIKLAELQQKASDKSK